MFWGVVNVVAGALEVVAGAATSEIGVGIALIADGILRVTNGIAQVTAALNVVSEESVNIFPENIAAGVGKVIDLASGKKMDEKGDFQKYLGTAQDIVNVTKSLKALKEGAAALKQYQSLYESTDDVAKLTKIKNDSAADLTLLINGMVDNLKFVADEVQKK